MSSKNEIDQKELTRLHILNKPILPLLIRMSVPTIIGMLIVMIYTLTDTFFVGLLDNKSMTAAIGVVFSFVSMIQAVGFWFGYGSGNIMSKKLGEQDDKEAAVISSLAIAFSIFIGFLITVFSWIFLLDLSKFIGGNASEHLLKFTMEYLKVIIIGIPFSLYSTTLYNQLRLCGNVKDGMIGLLLGIFSNMILDPIFIFGLKFGFVGAGYATLTGQIVSCISLTILAKRNKSFSISWKNVTCSKERIYHILVGGMPNFSRQVITSISLVLLNRVAASYGDSIIAAFTVSSRIVAIAYMIMIGWGQGFQPICAMNYGAKKYDRVQSAFTLTVVVGTIFLMLSATLLYLFSEHFIRMLSKDDEVIFIGVQILRMQCISMPLLGYFAVSSMLMQNIGKYFWSLFISISRQGIFYIPLLYLLSNFYGELGIYLLQPVSDILSFLLAVFIVHRNNKYVSIKLGEKGREEL
ncbi:MATE family efflux transporter [Fusobacterium necrophorum subsp. funduliforme]|uniref:MATE family efflux transporter n=1 Tax=Fusobacterium necrophorum TaxID=859 RepID=UPI00078797D5|nr:MATE family efflux transporter [Fusobacterium necrophorum]KYL01450.1 MATE family efflux transporter [Fusobacterium necrophorum subsp. funduliforme]KYM37859.1 MATE family efflux transporter [Fusobacterium necrophorum subsp. funduliforme]KYM49121.1 MATE family efflux transporter [Fusobacterium necrophorum subsp. funduliforme]KYM60842.1 MATE family efflux transporter [Fusobacterium necrophorum subsp. funduliforme]MDK4476710.1 MATE family efflux transporter [Fusobacterium necrophorum]